ncbi:arylesterase [Verrucomicrobia bacterium LW23]|nr:arylesterase [Verrucomicrobia bacterium LW23]
MMLMGVLVLAQGQTQGQGDAPLPSAPAASPPAEAKAGGPVVLIIGDSLAAGHGLDPSEAFPALVQEKIREAGWPFRVVNAGLSGDTSAGGLRRIDWLLRGGVDVLIVELGGNDGLRGISPKETRANLQGIIDRARRKNPAVEVVVAGMQMPPNMGEEYTTAYREIFPDIAKANNAALIPFLLEGVGGRPELNLPDRIHPTAEGHKIVAETVWGVLKPVLQKRQNRQSPNQAALPDALPESAPQPPSAGD